MFVLKEGRRPFLEFLRNLTPCGLLGATAIVFGVQLDFSRFALDNVTNSLAFFSCVTFAAAAYWSNASLFLEEAVRSLDRFGRLPGRLGRLTKSTWRVLLGSARIVYRRRRRVFLDLVVTTLLINAGLVVVLSAAINAARASLR